jgi:CHAT domain-containing protein/Tfp pilus assembly protein PilF
MYKREMIYKGVTAKTIFQWFLLTIIVIYCALVLSGCSEAILVYTVLSPAIDEIAGGKTQTFSGWESLELKSPVTDILDVTAEVGKTMGYDVSDAGKLENTLDLTSKSSNLTDMLIGKHSWSTLQVSSWEMGRRLEIYVSVRGNFGAGGQEAANRLINEFKTKLSERIGQPLELSKSDTTTLLPEGPFSLAKVHSDKTFGGILTEGADCRTKFDYRGALRAYQRGLELAEKANNKQASGVFHLEIGGIYYFAGNTSKALFHYDQALKRFKEIGDTRSQSSIFMLIGSIQHSLCNYSEAISCYEQSAKYLGWAGVAEMNIGNIYLEQGKFEDALKIYQQYPSINKFSLGHYYLTLKQYDRAKQIFKENIKDMESFAIKYNNPMMPESLLADHIALGLCSEGLEKYDEAKDYFQKAIEVIEKQRQGLTENQRQDFFSIERNDVFSRLAPYEGMIRVLLKEKAEGNVSKAFSCAEQAKSRSFLDALALQENRGKSPEDKAVLEKDREFQAAILQLRNKGTIEELKKVQEQYEEFIKEVKLQRSEISSLISVNPVPAEKLQTLLDQDSTLLEYYTSKDTLYAWLLTKDDIKVYEVALKEKDLEKKVDEFLLPNISNRSRKAAPVITLAVDEDYQKETTEEERTKNRERFSQVASDFYEIFMAPMEKDIKTEKLIIVPHGVLHKIPFAALTDGSKYLVDKYAISVLPAASIVEFLIKKRKPEKEKLLTLANPKTDYVPLDFAEQEGQTISALFPQKEFYLRENATETTAKEKASDFNVIHFATHGEFNDKQPLQSGLLFAKDEKNDGFLQVHEIFGMDLKNANLVTLSACETALSKIQGGDDLVGLSRGFIYAGTPSLLATLWNVDDESTSILMQNFYKNWQKGMSKPEALRQAQIVLKSMPQYKHPFYWAPFVMIGDWK